MKYLAIPPTRRHLLRMLPLAIVGGLVSCGGGEDNYESIDLAAAYDAITQGMSYTHVRSIVGRDPLSTVPNGTDTLLYRWETGRNTYLFSTLIVEMDKTQGVVTKTVTGPDGNKTESFPAS